MSADDPAWSVLTDFVEPESLEQAMELLSAFSSALFPAGPPGRDGLTWPDRSEVASLTNDGRIRTVEERLRAAEARFSTLVEQIPAVTFMAVLGQGENEVYVSPHIEQMLGYSQKEWLADPFLWYTRLHTEDRALWNEEFARGCRTGGPFRAECRFMARDGHIVWVHGHARVVKDEQGRPQFLQGVAFDITESKKAQSVLLENAVQKAKVQEEFEIARRVQRSLVPESPHLEGLELSATMIAADEVGGDYYDVQETPTGGWIAIGDVSGHGLNAGLVMLMLESAMASVQHSLPDSTASHALSIVNRVLFDNVAHRMHRKEYVTLMLLRYRRDGHISFAGGHQDIIICRAADGLIEWVRTPGPWMAIQDDLPAFEDEEKELHDGDLMILYTDGIIEARNRNGELFDVRRLCDVISETRHESVERIRDAVLDRVRRFMHEQEDDMTLLVARYRAPSPGRT